MKVKTLLIIFFLAGSFNLYCQNDTIMAKFLGFDDIREYVQRGFNYPPEAVEKNIQGTVIYKIKVKKSGCIDSIIFIKSPGEILNTEIRRVLSVTNCSWTPAFFKGEPIDIWINTKARFIIQ